MTAMTKKAKKVFVGLSTLESTAQHKAGLTLTGQTGVAKKKPRVFVGLSGGVDSSVSAALLKKEGYDVTGVFIKVWSPDWLPRAQPQGGVGCTWREDRLDAMRVSAHLNIPFITLDLEKEYKQGVVDYMVSEYKAGRVPNPDVMCNKEIKFGAFLDFAKKEGTDYIATGHYARLGRETRNSKPEIRNKPKTQNSKSQTAQLLKGRDDNKDQSYFLWTLTQEQLEYTLFPIGEYQKPEVRKLAKKFGLPTAEKKDSQGLCFMGKVDMQEFLTHFMNEKNGEVLNEKGDTVGNHSGAMFYTIGQRHGFEINKKTPEDTPYYVVAKNLKKNTLTVSHDKKQEEFSRAEISLEQVNWIGNTPEENKKYEAKLWYRGQLQKCSVVGERVLFDEPQNVSAGQSVVLYYQDTCLGGGIVS